MIYAIHFIDNLLFGKFVEFMESSGFDGKYYNSDFS